MQAMAARRTPQAEGTGQDSGGGIGTITTAVMIREEGTMPTREHRDAKTGGKVRGKENTQTWKRILSVWRKRSKGWTLNSAKAHQFNVLEVS